MANSSSPWNSYGIATLIVAVLGVIAAFLQLSKPDSTQTSLASEMAPPAGSSSNAPSRDNTSSLGKFSRSALLGQWTADGVIYEFADDNQFYLGAERLKAGTWLIMVDPKKGTHGLTLFSSATAQAQYPKFVANWRVEESGSRITLISEEHGGSVTAKKVQKLQLPSSVTKKTAEMLRQKESRTP